MKKSAAFLVLFLVAVLASESAEAHGRRGRIGLGFYFGAPLVAAPFYSPYYRSPYYHNPYRPYYYYPPPAYYSPPAQTWIERDPLAPSAPSAAPEPSSPAAPEASWFYCPDSGAYYPAVGQCPGGWQRVAPRPAS